MDMPILDEVFVMGDGFVLNFSNRTFAEFFREELEVDIDHRRSTRPSSNCRMISTNGSIPTTMNAPIRAKSVKDRTPMQTLEEGKAISREKFVAGT